MRESELVTAYSPHSERIATTGHCRRTHIRSARQCFACCGRICSIARLLLPLPPLSRSSFDFSAIARLEQAVCNTQVCHGFHIKRVDTLEEGIAYLVNLHTFITKYFKVLFVVAIVVVIVVAIVIVDVCAALALLT